MRKLTSKELTQAYKDYARKHGYTVRTVRAVTVLKQAAVTAYRCKHGAY